MKLRYMGTAACERIPGMFCNCEVCRRALEKGGKNLEEIDKIHIGTAESLGARCLTRGQLSTKAFSLTGTLPLALRFPGAAYLHT